MNKYEVYTTINYSQIIKETENALLIQLPNCGSWKKYQFWYPKSMIETFKGLSKIGLKYFTDDIKISKYNKKTKKVTTDNINYDILIDEFGELEEEYKQMKKSYIKVKKPKKIENKYEIDESLFR